MRLHVDRPSALDLAFLDLETPQAPLHVGWTLRFGGAPPSLAALRRHLDARLDLVPRFRRRLERAPLGLGSPHWADDPAFDVARHAFAVSLPAPGGPAELREAAGALLSQPLPAGRPLWRLYLVEGLRPDGFALVGQVHHALVDGVAAVEVALLLFGPAPEPGRQRAWTPAPPPSVRAAVGATAAARVRAAAAIARGAPAVLRPGAGAAAREATRALETVTRPAPATALNRSATRERAVAWAQVPLAAACEAGARHHATINDVLLAACSLALRRALRRRGERPQALRALVPVDVREDDPAAALGNRISFLAIDLPAGEPDAERVLRTVRARTAAAKGGGDAAPLAALAQAADALPGAGRRLVARTAARAAGFNLVVSNVPGPSVPLTLLGRPLQAIHPMVPLLHGHALSVGAISYEGRLLLGLGADAAVVPDVVEIARDVEAAFDALRVAAAVPPGGDTPGLTPWRARARARRQRAANR
jgi:diacylglycerol O-acyltransferase / wax synthase